MATVVVRGVFPSFASAQHAVDELLKLGFKRNDIRLPGAGELGEQPEGAEVAVRPSATIFGATLGGTLGAMAAAVAAYSAVLNPDNPLLASGPIAVALTGFSAGAAAGGVTGSLIGRKPEGVSPAGAAEADGTTLGVHVQDGRTRLVRYVLGTCGAERITKQ